MMYKYQIFFFFFLQLSIYFVGDDGCQNFLIFAPTLTFQILNSNKTVIHRISTRISYKKTKPFDINLEQTKCNLANDRVVLKINNPALVQKILHRYIVPSF